MATDLLAVLLCGKGLVEDTLGGTHRRVLSKIRKFRAFAGREVYISYMNILIGHLKAKGFGVTDVKELARLHGPDEYENELSVVSDVWAYFEIASKRVLDNVSMIFEVLFAQGFEKELRIRLTSDLKLV